MMPACRTLYGHQARFFEDELHPALTHAKLGTVGMAGAGKDMNASQFYITLATQLGSLDGKHTIFGEVSTLTMIRVPYMSFKASHSWLMQKIGGGIHIARPSAGGLKPLHPDVVPLLAILTHPQEQV